MFPQPGTYTNVTNSVYHGSEGISSSTLKAMLKSAAEYKQKYIEPSEPKSSEAMLKGSVVHKLVLEPDDFHNEFIIQPEMPGRNTKEGKKAHAEFQAVAEESGKTPVPIAIYEAMQKCANSLLANPAISNRLIGGVPELSVCWNDLKTGLLCKCRPDYWIESSQIIFDLKTSRDASPYKFSYHSGDFSYHLQAAWYLRGMRAAGYPNAKFIFVVVETEPPYHWALYSLGEKSLKPAHKAADILLGQINGANTFGVYPNSYTGDAVMEIDVPVQFRNFGGLV